MMNEFITQWVAPYYLNILHGNYYRLLEGETQMAFNENVKNRLVSINYDVVTRLLSGGWREQLTGSWFCGLKNWDQFADVIGTKLVESKAVYAGQGHCFALACFANDKSVKYLTKYLNTYLPQNNLVYDQAWVMPALMWIDEISYSNHSTHYLTSGGLWEKYVEDKEINTWKLSCVKEHFWKVMSYCQENFAELKAG